MDDMLKLFFLIAACATVAAIALAFGQSAHEYFVRISPCVERTSKGVCENQSHVLTKVDSDWVCKCKSNVSPAPSSVTP